MFCQMGRRQMAPAVEGWRLRPLLKPLRRMLANKRNISASYGINLENSLAKHGRLVLRLIVPPNLAEIHFSLA
jgi:hypothetical protein